MTFKKGNIYGFKKGYVPWNKGMNGNKNPMFGKHHTEETKKKISISHKGKSTWNKGKSPTEETKKKLSEARLNQIFPHKDTSIERKLQAELIIRGMPYTTHLPITGQPDIAFPDRKIVVFLDGCYWHKCPICGFGNGREKDTRITEQLRSDGWLVLRFWEHEINGNVKGIVDEIEEIIYGQRKTV